MNNSVADPLSFFQAVHIGALKKRKQTHLVYQEKVFMSDNIKILNSTKDSFLKWKFWTLLPEKQNNKTTKKRKQRKNDCNKHLNW